MSVFAVEWHICWERQKVELLRKITLKEYRNHKCLNPVVESKWRGNKWVIFLIFFFFLYDSIIVDSSHRYSMFYVLQIRIYIVAVLCWKSWDLRWQIRLHFSKVGFQQCTKLHYFLHFTHRIWGECFEAVVITSRDSPFGLTRHNQQLNVGKSWGDWDRNMPFKDCTFPSLSYWEFV